MIGELTRGGFNYVDKGGEITIDVSASHGVQAVGTVARHLPFHTKLENESEDISFFAFSASMGGQPIWEGTIRIPSEELEGKYAHLCIRALLKNFSKDMATEDDCD